MKTFILEFLIPLALTYGMAYVCYFQYLMQKERWIERKKRRKEYFNTKRTN